MPLWSAQAIIAFFAVMSLLSGIWLLLNLRAVARTFRGTADLEPGPGPRGPSRRAVWTAFFLFHIGWIASIAVWVWARDDDAPQVIETANVVNAILAAA